MTSLGEKIYQKLNAKSLITDDLTISDLREMDFDGKGLTHDQKRALYNFDRYRLWVLNLQETEKKFHKKYIELQAMSNLSPFQEFLKEDYVTT